MVTITTAKQVWGKVETAGGQLGAFVSMVSFDTRELAPTNLRGAFLRKGF